ncbi:Condensin complex subunit 2 [Seminavis robusta]|uniref:Condensin complex subunit 2 n=1 Tax=Seminavis robusta TaxID=568900 RepID=A0A9N8H9U8_9STRA|nr:Condensin complex subunit 2 [Seminavis robusta]|eukprot:Sro293_g109920.1 Condensin complex subunit 2 (778) ;mRNA; r:39321-41742
MDLDDGNNSDQPRPKQRRRRRRSSARFLRLTGRLMEDIDEVEEEAEEDNVVESDQHLGDMYKRAIRMNAENRINASNSWNLRLIENIDKFLGEDQEEKTADIDEENVDPNVPTTSRNKEKRVNFTKASCTLDASVKIYSYRVDDVHLSSYKVLANLNRTENEESSKNKKKQSNQSEATQSNSDSAEDDNDQEAASSGRSNKSSGSTLETNVANINMNKHDSAFDIDPLFHKMSKTFDEGGAKGLLLVNLGVGDNGCNIVFDSKAESNEDGAEQDSSASDDQQESTRQEGMVDISSLVGKLRDIEETTSTSIESMTLVPQLAFLREQFAELKQEGFVDTTNKASRRYASTQEEENEADMSIHQEAMERSRRSSMGRSFATEEEQDDDDGAPMFAPDDFGGGDDDDDDDHEDGVGFEPFIHLDESQSEGRFSALSFRDSYSSTSQQDKRQSQADVMLDAICSGKSLGAGEYEFFDTQALETSMSGNLWAGSAHWKRTEPARKRKEDTATKGKKKKTTKSKKGKKKNDNFAVDLTAKVVVEDLLRKPPKGKRGSNPLQLSKAVVTKHTKIDNLLPPDSGIGIDTLAGLFLRPNTVMQPAVSNDSSKGSKPRKSVCFDTTANEMFGGMAMDDDDGFGDGDDDGGGFVFADDANDDDDFVSEELKRIRKVDTKSVQVGYATIAKKVDVRRLKRDLWTEIETQIDPNETADRESMEVSSLQDGLSFQEAVNDLEESKTQGDVTLPFYFICVLHLANEKGLRLESSGLNDFVIHNDADVTKPSV